MNLCGKHRISLLPYNPLARGLLGGKYSLNTRFEDIRHNVPMFRGAKYRFNIEAVDQLKQVARFHNVSILSLVLSWMLRFHAVTSLIVGIRNASQIREICQSPVIDMDTSICQAIDEVLAERKRKLKKRYWYLEAGKCLIRNRHVKDKLYNLYLNMTRR